MKYSHSEKKNLATCWCEMPWSKLPVTLFSSWSRDHSQTETQSQTGQEQNSNLDSMILSHWAESVAVISGCEVWSPPTELVERRTAQNHIAASIFMQLEASGNASLSHMNHDVYCPPTPRTPSICDAVLSQDPYSKQRYFQRRRADMPQSLLKKVALRHRGCCHAEQHSECRSEGWVLHSQRLNSL